VSAAQFKEKIDRSTSNMIKYSNLPNICKSVFALFIGMGKKPGKNLAFHAGCEWSTLTKYAMFRKIKQ